MSNYDIPGLFTLSGSPYRGNAKMEGQPLRPEQLFTVLDLEQAGLAAVKEAVTGRYCHAAAERLLLYFRDRRKPGWLLKHDGSKHTGAQDTLPKLTADESALTVAANALQHRFQPYNRYPVYDYGPNLDWDADPYNDLEWFCAMQRLYGWDGAVTACYSATGDERYAGLWVNLLADWMRKNPLTAERLPFSRAWDAIQCGCRVQGMVGYLPYYLNSPALTPPFLVEFLTSLYNHARRIELMPFPNVDNFAQIETMGLGCIAFLFPEFADSVHWRATAVGRMVESMTRQVLADGVHGEVTPSYHAMLAGYYLDFLELAGQAEDVASLLAPTTRMVDFLAAIGLPDKLAFCVGDSERFDVRPCLRRAASVLGLNRWKMVSEDSPGASAPEQRQRAFPDGGFYVFRSGWQATAVCFALHCGPASIERPTGFHTQFDNGTFELMAHGRRLMTDPGVYSYRGGAPEREAFRRTAAHQTLTLDNRNSARAGRLIHWCADDGRGNAHVTVENAAYPGLIHRRTAFFVANRYIVLVDEALGNARGDIDLHFQLVPGPSVIDPASKTARTVFPDGGNVLVWSDPAAPVTLTEEEAWFSLKHGVKEPLPALRYRHNLGQAPVRFLTLLVPFTGIDVPQVSARITDGGADDLRPPLGGGRLGAATAGRRSSPHGAEALFGERHLAVTLAVAGASYRVARTLDAKGF